MEHLYLLRFGELTLKSPQVRKRMIKRLIANLKDALKRHDIPFEIQRNWSRILVKTSKPNEAEQIFSRLFGLTSFSELTLHKYESKETLLEQAEAFFRPYIENKSFAVRTRRDKKLPLSGREIDRELGAKLLPYAKKVDLSHPDVTCHIELKQQQEVHFFIDKNAAPGGMPLGIEDRALALISGGFDSPVASWLIARRGVLADYLFFELGGFPQRSSIYALLHHLYSYWLYGHRPRLYIIPGEPVLQQLHDKIPEKFWNVMLKRIFYQVAHLLSQQRQYTAIITGEAVAQVSSQTLSNLRSIQYKIDTPILRPLLTYEKQDIIALSRKIGTHDISAKVKEYCAISSQKPATRSDPLYILELEEKLGGSNFYQSLIDDLEIVPVNQLEPQLADFLDIVTETIAPNDIWIDIREKNTPPLTQPHLHITAEQLLQYPEQLDKNKTYLLFCNGGMQSAHIAHQLKQQGFLVHAFAGGISRLKKYLLQHPLPPQP